MTGFSLEELYGDTPVAGPSRDQFRVTPQEQAERDVGRMAILQREYNDPSFDGGTRAAVGREIKRAGGKPAAQKPVPAQDSFSLDELYGAPAAKPDAFSKESLAADNRDQLLTDILGTKERSIGGIAKEVGVKTAKNFATIGDMMLGIPYQAMSVMADLNTRLGQLVQGVPAKEIARRAEAARNEVLGAAPRALTDAANRLASNQDASQVEAVTQDAMGWIDEKAQAIEKATSGVVSKEDVNSLVNEIMGLYGVRGVGAAAKAKVGRMGEAAKAEGQAKPLTAEEATAQRVERRAEEAEVAQREQVKANSDARALEARSVERLQAQAKTRELQLAEQKAAKAESVAIKQKRADVKAAFAEDPLWADYLRDRAETEALVRESSRAEQARLTPEEMAPRTRPGERTAIDEQARTIESIPGLPPDQLRVTEPTPLESGLAKVARGRSFALDAAELAAIKSSKSSFNRPEIYVPKGQRGAVDAKAFGEALDKLKETSPEDLLNMGKAAAAGVTRTDRQGAKYNVNLREENFGANQDAKSVLVEARDPDTGARRGFVDFALGEDGVLRAENAKVAPEYRGRGVAEMLYKEAREAGYDIAPGRAQTEAGAKMVERLQAGGTINKQRGGADPELLKKIGAAAGGAAAGLYLADDNQAGAAGLGAIGGLLLAGKAGGQLARGADYGLGLVSTRIKNISPTLARRARDYEGSLLRTTHEKIAATDDFLVGLNKLKGDAKTKLDLALVSNDAKALNEVLAANPELRAAWSKASAAIKQTGADLVKAGVLKGLRQDYIFPRIVTDRAGLLDKLGFKARETLEQRLHEAEAKAVKATGEGLTPVEQSTIINQYLRGLRGNDFAPGFTKGRVIGDVTADLRSFYAAPAEALHTYLASTTRAIEKARFFGREAVKDAATGRVDTNASIGEVVRRELDSGKITFKQSEELRSMLESRFGAGERGSGEFVQHVRNLTNAGLLGNIVSAGSQLGDTFVSAYAHGMRPTLEAVANKLAGKQKTSLRDFGLLDHISEDFVSTNRSAKFLRRTLKWSGFSKIDEFGKDVHLNAALSKFERLAQTEKGQAKIAEKYREAYGEDYGRLIDGLKSRKLNDEVRSMLFSELSDMQPISKLEMPQGYLDMPNGRFVYTLKSFMLKQVDIVRRDAYNEIKAGNVVKGVGNLLKFSLVLGVAGATTAMLQDWILGRKVDFKATDIADSMLKTFGWTRWVADTVKQGKPLEAARDVVVPPYKMWDDIVRRDPKAVQYIPLVGKLIYNRGMDGAEKADAAQEKADRKRERANGKGYGL